MKIGNLNTPPPGASRCLYGRSSYYKWQPRRTAGAAIHTIKQYYLLSSFGFSPWESSAAPSLCLPMC